METERLIANDLQVLDAAELVVRRLPADLETPISAYLKLAGPGPSFLLESVTGGERLARYSFIGVEPTRVYLLRGGGLEVHDFTLPGLPPVRCDLDGDPLDVLRMALAAGAPAAAGQAGLPRLTGGLVGYLGYEMMRYFEPSVALAPHPELPDAILLQADILAAFDHVRGELVLMGSPTPGGLSLEQVEARLDEMEQRLCGPLPAASGDRPDGRAPGLQAEQCEQEFVGRVQAAKEHIAAGDIFQVVLSQRISAPLQTPPFDLYRALRRLNPSPYMFYFDFGDLAGEPLRLIGASPELHARLEGRTASLRPIAGTRQRSAVPAADLALERELLADPKERAEHVMLVDLGRNDLGRICATGTVRVAEQMVVERYSHVMHLVSQVEGRLRDGLDAFDLLRATFPAGTVSGAPKIRAMQIIHDLEPGPRGPYAGVVGYFSYDGNMDTCIAIRTLVAHGERVYLQAGAGIVADSDPQAEYQETLNKLSAQAAALRELAG